MNGFDTRAGKMRRHSRVLRHRSRLSIGRNLLYGAVGVAFMVLAVWDGYHSS